MTSWTPERLNKREEEQNIFYIRAGKQKFHLGDHKIRTFYEKLIETREHD